MVRRPAVLHLQLCFLGGYHVVFTNCADGAARAGGHGHRLFLPAQRPSERAGHAALKTVIGNITLPVVLFNAFLTAEYNAGLVLGFAVVFTACCIACAAGYALRPLVAPHGRFLPFLMSSFEVGMLGYALYGLLAGENGSLSTLAMFDIGQTLFAYTVWLALLKVAGGERADAKSLLKNMFTNPAFCGMALGIVLGGAGRGQMGAGLACLRHCHRAYQLPFGAHGLPDSDCGGLRVLAEGQPAAPVLITVALRLAVMAALCAVSALVVFRFLPFDKLTMAALLVLFSLPAPFIIPLFADVGDDAEYVSTSYSAQTLATMLCFVAIAVYTMA